MSTGADVTDAALERFLSGPAPYADRLTGVYDLLFDGLNQITECTTSEDETNG
jgi:hypothetical protein